MEKALKLAMDGGHVKAGLCLNDNFKVCVTANPELLLLDPNFWQCLGKAEGWDEEFNLDGSLADGFSIKTYLEWQYRWHQFIDHIADGGDIDTFFNNLIK